MRGSRRSLVVTVVAAALALSGTTAIAVSVVSQRDPPQPQRSRWSSVSSAAPAVPHSPRPTKALPPSKPVAVDIPAIGVQSTVQQLGLNEDGTLEVPRAPRYDEPAWYEGSPTPGSLGPSIISGHVDSAENGPSVFFKLGDLEPGDEVAVTRADGRVARFVVEEVRRYPKDEFPTSLVYGDLDDAGLRLITCGGAFDRKSREYLDNVIVFASLTGTTTRSSEEQGDQHVSTQGSDRKVLRGFPAR